MADEKKELSPSNEDNNSQQEFDEFTVLQEVEEQDINFSVDQGEEATPVADETSSRVATKEIRFTDSQQDEQEENSQPTEQSEDIEEAEIDLNAETPIYTGQNQQVETVVSQSGGSSALVQENQQTTLSEENVRGEQTDTNVSGAPTQTFTNLSQTEEQEQENTLFVQDQNVVDDSVDDSNPSDNETPDTGTTPDTPEPEPEPIYGQAFIRLSHETHHQSEINHTHSFELPLTEVGVKVTLTGAELNIPKVADSAKISYEYKTEKALEITLDSAWNSVKNIEVISDTLTDVEINNFVHVDVKLTSDAPANTAI